MKISKTKHLRLIKILPIIFLGLILRLISLNQSFWLDEAITAKVANFSFPEILTFLKGDFNPPLYYLIIKFWADIFGNSEISLRIPSVIFSLLSVFLLFLLAVDLSKNKAKIAALFLATSPLHIYYSQEARAYSLACFLSLLTLFLFQKSLKNSKFWPLFSVSLVAMAFSHYQTILLLPVFPLFLGINKDKKNLIKTLIAFLPLFIAFIFYWPILRSQLSLGGGIEEGWINVIGKLNGKNIGLISIKMIIGRISIENKIIYALLSIVLVAVFWGLATLGYSLLYSLALFLPIILGIIISFRLPVLSYFRFTFLLPFFYLLIAAGIKKLSSKLSSKRIAIILLTFILAVNLICSLTYLLNPRFHRENWRLAVNYLEKNSPQPPVFILSQIDTAFHYYNQGKLKTISLDDFDQYNQINLISYGLSIFDPEDKIRTRLGDLGFKAVWGDSFNFVGVERWEKKKLER